MADQTINKYEVFTQKFYASLLAPGYSARREHDIQMRKGATILYVGVQKNRAYFWVQEPSVSDTAEELETRYIEIYGTGEILQELPDGVTRRYIGTVLLDNGDYVWHMYELEGP